MTAKTKPAFELVMERVVDAPLDRVWDAWADPERLARWFAPRPLTLSVEKMDLRSGGGFAMTMHFPDGKKHSFSGVYREVVPRSSIVWTGEFPGDPADNMRTEIAFESRGARTRISVRQTFAVLTPINERPTQGAKQGWTMTLDQLDAFCRGRPRETLVVRRRFGHPPEKVFAAWIDPARVRKWLFTTPTGSIVRCEIDSRPGGSFTIVDRRDGEEIEHVGRYETVDPPRRLVFTFAVPKFSKEETLVSVEIRPDGKGCELTLTHEKVLPEWASRTREGWGKLLESLESVL